MEGEEVGQFLGQIVEIEWPLKKSVGRRGGVRTPGGQTRIRRVIIFRGLVLLRGARMR